MNQSSIWKLLVKTALVYVRRPTAIQVSGRKMAHVITRAGAPSWLRSTSCLAKSAMSIVPAMSIRSNGPKPAPSVRPCYPST